MIRNIRINSYRNLEGVKLENLGLMNVIVGENNTGKTSLLECINLIKDENVLKNILDGIQWREYRVVYLGEVKRNYQMYHAVMNSFDLRQGANKYLSVDFETVHGEFSVGIRGAEFEDFKLLLVLIRIVVHTLQLRETHYRIQWSAYFVTHISDKSRFQPVCLLSLILCYC